MPPKDKIAPFGWQLSHLHRSSLQGRRKVWKSWGASSNVKGIICLLVKIGFDNLSKNGSCPSPPCPFIVYGPVLAPGPCWQCCSCIFKLKVLCFCIKTTLLGCIKIHISEWIYKSCAQSQVFYLGQRYTYRVLQTIQMKLIHLCVWAELAFLGSTKTALKFKDEIWIC